MGSVSPSLRWWPRNDCSDGKRDHLLGVKKMWPRWYAWAVRPSDAHQEPCIPVPFRMNFISSLSLWLLFLKFSPSPVPCPIIPKCTQLTHIEAVPPVIWEVPVYFCERQAGFPITLAAILDFRETAVWLPADLRSSKQLSRKVRSQVYKS